MKANRQNDVLTVLSEEHDTKKSAGNSLVLWNDDFNTFDHVIKSLITICKQDSLQAEQCALLVHYKGKCSIKDGSYTELEPYKYALEDRGLTASIE